MAPWRAAEGGRRPQPTPPHPPPSPHHPQRRQRGAPPTCPPEVGPGVPEGGVLCEVGGHQPVLHVLALVLVVVVAVRPPPAVPGPGWRSAVLCHAGAGAVDGLAGQQGGAPAGAPAVGQHAAAAAGGGAAIRAAAGQEALVVQAAAGGGAAGHCQGRGSQVVAVDEQRQAARQGRGRAGGRLLLLLLLLRHLGRRRLLLLRLASCCSWATAHRNHRCGRPRACIYMLQGCRLGGCGCCCCCWAAAGRAAAWMSMRLVLVARIDHPRRAAASTDCFAVAQGWRHISVLCLQAKIRGPLGAGRRDATRKARTSTAPASVPAQGCKLECGRLQHHDPAHGARGGLFELLLCRLDPAPHLPGVPASKDGHYLGCEHNPGGYWALGWHMRAGLVRVGQGTHTSWRLAVG